MKYKAIPIDIPAAAEPKMHVIFQGEARKTIQEKAQEMIKCLDEDNAAPIPEEKGVEEQEKKLSRKTIQKKNKREKNQLTQSMYEQTNALFSHLLEGKPKPISHPKQVPQDISMRMSTPTIPLARRDTKESSSISPETTTLRHSAIIKKWQRLIHRVIRFNQLKRAICMLSEIDKKIMKQSKLINRLKTTTEVKLKQLCLPKENMH